MPVLSNYNEFSGRHWETGTVRNFWAYRGITAPHTNQPYSEAMLMGISGGIVMAYFSFAYSGEWDPQARILTRNTFDPMDRMLERMGVIQHIEQTSQPEKARRNLINTLDEGSPAIVWADVFSLPWCGVAMPMPEPMWWMSPILVYGYDEAAATVLVADRARIPLTCTTGELDAARARIKKDKFKLLSLDPPNEGHLIAAVQKGIWDCIKLFTEPPPKGGKDSFGFAAYNRLIEVLTKPKHRLSWEKEFPAGPKLYSALLWMFNDIMLFGKDGSAERDVYANFLDEAAVLLDKPGLKEAAAQFRTSGEAWNVLADLILPDDVPLLSEARALMTRKSRLFLDQGNAGLTEIGKINGRLKEIRATMENEFPLDASGVTALKKRIATQVAKIAEIEGEAVTTLTAAIGS